MKKMTRFMAMAILMTGWTAASAQNTVTLEQLSRASKQRQQQQQQQQASTQQRSHTTSAATESEAFATLFVEYNPTTMHSSYNGHSDNTSFQGLSVGGNYFMPFSGSLGVDAGLKLQYFFRNETEGQVKYKMDMISATIPVDLAYDWHATDGLSVYPYAGIYGRFNISGTGKEEYGGQTDKYNIFKKEEMGGEPWKRFQLGWQAGVNLRISNVFTVGGGFWMDLTEIADDVTLYGFNVTVGVSL